MANLIVFDLDGVLVDSKELHYESLNKALAEVDQKYAISKQEQDITYEGLTTGTKLALLTKLKNLPESLHFPIWQSKQQHSAKSFESLAPDGELISIFSLLKSNGFLVAVASNSIRATLDTCLTSLGISEFIDVSLSNEDVSDPKPSPEIYLKAMNLLEVSPKNTVIFEDSNIGRAAALSSKATLVGICDRSDLTESKVRMAMSLATHEKKAVNVLIPMAGLGSRFADAGYDLPKPLIDVDGKPMIQRVVEDIAIDGNYIYIVQREHYEDYNLEELLTSITPNCEIVQINGVTEGAAVTSLTAKHLIDNDFPLVIANSDQITNWDSDLFLTLAQASPIDGSIVVFKADNPKWSYADVDDFGYVTSVAEKQVISEHATAGIYLWTKGSDYVTFAEQMIHKNLRTNGEFYICPVYNEALLAGKKFTVFNIDSMNGIGTPEDLEAYLND
jgi:HAD superfamily hydrolase (TIGR01509 family)